MKTISNVHRRSRRVCAVEQFRVARALLPAYPARLTRCTRPRLTAVPLLLQVSLAQHPDYDTPSANNWRSGMASQARNSNSGFKLSARAPLPAARPALTHCAIDSLSGFFRLFCCRFATAVCTFQFETTVRTWV